MPKIKFYIIRHAAVEDSSRIYGASDIPIKNFEFEEPQILKKLLPRDAICISSPLSRAVQTLRKIKNTLSKDCETLFDDRLREQNFGIMELTDPDETDYKNGRPYWHMSSDFRPTGGESFEDVYLRVSEFLREKQENNNDSNYLVCTHGGVLKAILAYILDISLEQCAIFDIAPLSLSIFEFKPNRHGKNCWWIKCLGTKLINSQ